MPYVTLEAQCGIVDPLWRHPNDVGHFGSSQQENKNTLSVRIFQMFFMPRKRATRGTGRQGRCFQYLEDRQVREYAVVSSRNSLWQNEIENITSMLYKIIAQTGRNL
jgi:hypothetical protein